MTTRPAQARARSNEGIRLVVLEVKGELELVDRDGTRVQCERVLMTGWRTRLPMDLLP
jgi:hypothetical protein